MYEKAWCSVGLHEMNAHKDVLRSYFLRNFSIFLRATTPFYRLFPFFSLLWDALQLFKPEDLLKAKFELLSDTSMVDSTIDIYKEMNPGNEESAGTVIFKILQLNLPGCLFEPLMLSRAGRV